jgi:AraC-like DNA-binding protein
VAGASRQPVLNEAADLDEIAAQFPDWKVECIHLGPGPMNHRAVRVAFGSGSVTSFQMARAGILRGATAPDTRALFASFSPAQPPRAQGRPIGGQTSLVLEPGARLDLYLPEQCLALVLAIRADPAHAPASVSAADGQLRALSEPHAAFLKSCMESLEALPTPATPGRIDRGTHRRLRDLLESAAPALILETAARPHAKAARSQRHLAVTRACAYIDAHLREPMALADLCTAAGVCTRTLEYGFRDFYELGPMAYVRNLRLCRVRSELQHPLRATGSVSSAARRWSFTHMGQFSCDYRALFGEVPSSTLTRHRGDPTRAKLDGESRGSEFATRSPRP